jgi:hypothetical protein
MRFCCLQMCRDLKSPNLLVDKDYTTKVSGPLDISEVSSATCLLMPISAHCNATIG